MVSPAEQAFPQAKWWRGLDANIPAGSEVEQNYPEGLTGVTEYAY
jgi:hypothetical protein